MWSMYVCIFINVKEMWINNYKQVTSDLSVFIEQVVFLLWWVETLVKDIMEAEEWTED